MLAALVVLIRTLALICSGHREVPLENVALRQQLAMFRRTVARPHIRPSDRLFWILLANAWRDWRTALTVVNPDTVVRWHRQWLRRRWRHRSAQTRPGRPSTNAAIRTLVNQMGAANPLWEPVPATVIAWYRRGFRLWWVWKGRCHMGRPTVSADVRTLIRTMAQANPRWDAPRIHGELLNLGIDVCQATVAKYMGRRRQPPSQTWRTFLCNHIGQLS
jgi:hypothetical protein